MSVVGVASDQSDFRSVFLLLVCARPYRRDVSVSNRPSSLGYGSLGYFYISTQCKRVCACPADDVGASISVGSLCLLQALLAVWGPGIITGSLCIVVVSCVHFLPETRGKDLPTEIEDIEAWYTQKEPKKSLDDEQGAAA